MMKIPLYKRASFWNLVVQSFQIIISSIQVVSMSNEDKVSDYNFYLAIGQGALAIISLWTKDADRNNIIDIAEETTETTITVESKGPVTVKDVTTETP
jgi:hypothetical protein